MTTVVSIVEGDGEVQALPVLLRRLAEWRTPEIYIEVLQPIRVRRDRFLNRPEEFRRFLMLASSKCDEGGWILILLDADDDCPATLGGHILEDAKQLLPGKNISVVLANREYEAWYIASAASLHGVRGLSTTEKDQAVEAELIRNAKGWLAERMVDKNYREIADQPAMSALMNLQQAFGASRSFRKLCEEWSRNIGN